MTTMNQMPEINQENKWKRTFWIIWSGQAFSILGSAAVGFAIIWWLTVQTGSAMVLAMAAMMTFLPQAVIGPFAGAWIDRLSRKTVMICADLFIAAVTLILGIAFLIGNPPTWLIYLILFLRGVGGAVHIPAMQAAMPMFVPESELVKAGGWSGFIQSGSLMLGPVLGTFLMTVFSIPAVILIDIIGAVIAVSALAMVKIPDPPVDLSARQPIFREMLDGLREINQNKLLKAICIIIMLSVLVYVPVSSLFPLMVNGHFNGTAWHASIVEFIFAGGLLASGLILGIWGGLKDKFLMMHLSLGCLGLALALSGILPPSAFWSFALLSGLMGLTGSFFNVPFMAYVQSTVDPASLGRVFSLILSLMSFAVPLGLFVAGPVAEKVGIATWFLISGVLIMVTAIFGHYFVRRLEKNLG